jgi:hypothetical protein
MIRVFAADDRDRDRLARLWRWLVVRGPRADRGEQATVESAAEHEMLATVSAARATAGVPEAVIAYRVGSTAAGEGPSSPAWTPAAGDWTCSRPTRLAMTSGRSSPTWFQANFADEPDVVIPTAYPELSRQKVLTMAMISGHPFTDRPSVEAAGWDVDQLDTYRLPAPEAAGMDGATIVEGAIRTVHVVPMRGWGRCEQFRGIAAAHAAFAIDYASAAIVEAE